MNIRNRFSFAVAGLAGAALAAGLALLAGCPSQTTEQARAPAPVAHADTFAGAVFGGRQPISGAVVVAYALPPDATASTAATPIGGTITQSDGSFSMTFSPTPATGAVILVTASGGNSLGGSPGSSSNAAIALITVAGAYCDNTQSGCGFPADVNINELTTAAYAYSLSNFTSDRGLRGPEAGVAQGVNTFFNLVDPMTGRARVPNADAAMCTGTGEPTNCAALRRLDTLANIAAACVNTSADTSGACQTLFTAATPADTASAPGNIYSALANVAREASVRNRGAAIYALVNSESQVYSPALTTAPRAWTLALRFGENTLNPNAAGVHARKRSLLDRYAGSEASDFAPNGYGNRLQLPPQSAVKLLENRATLLRAHAPDRPIELTFALKLRNVSALKAFLRDVATPGSSMYRHYLTPRRFTAMYGPSGDDVAAVTGWLAGQGIRVTGVSPNRTLIRTRATTAAYEKALSIRINDYRMDGRTFYSTTDAPILPRAIAGRLNGILGLNHGVRMHPHSHVEPPRSLGSRTAGLQPRAPAPTTSYFNPQQIQVAYDWPSVTEAANGASVTIAIVTALSNDIATGANTAYDLFWSQFGLPTHAVNVTTIGTPASSSTAGTGETTLDMEWSGAMAPGATIHVYTGADASFATFTTLYNKVVTDNTAQVMTTSWGACEADGGTNPATNYSATTDDPIFMQAAAQGISMFAAAGDHGSADNCAANSSNNNADYPASSPWVTASNGTILSIADTTGTYLGETAWYLNAGGVSGWGTGGAVSILFAEPFWQTGPGVVENGFRNNSDLALNAGPVHPYITVDYFSSGPSGPGYYFSGTYGTSAVAPMLAGLFADGVSHQPGYVRLGQANEQIYNDANAHYADDFHDVTTGNNGAFSAGTGWDHPTGWGSPKAANLLQHIGVQGSSALAVDENGNVWVTNYNGDTLSEFNAQGNFLGSFGAGNLSGPVAVTPDYIGHIWVANYQGDDVAEFSADNGDFLVSVPLTAPTALAVVSPTVAGGTGTGYVIAAGETNKIIEIDANQDPPTFSGEPDIGVDDPVGLAQTSSFFLVASHGNNSVCVSIIGCTITGFGINGPLGVAFDLVGSAGGIVWVTNNNGNSLTAVTMTQSGSGFGVSAGGGGLDGPGAIAVDGAHQVWVTNNFGHSISTFAAAPGSGSAAPMVTPISPPAPSSSLDGGGYSGGGLAWPRGIAIDAAGNIWTTSNAPGDYALVEFIGLAAPAQSP